MILADLNDVGEWRIRYLPVLRRAWRDGNADQRGTLRERPIPRSTVASKSLMASAELPSGLDGHDGKRVSVRVLDSPQSAMGTTGPCHASVETPRFASVEQWSQRHKPTGAELSCAICPAVAPD